MSELTKRICHFAVEMCKTWGALITGGFIIGIIASWQWTGHLISTRIGWTIIVGGIIVSAFQVWSRQAERADSTKRKGQYIFILKAITRLPEGHLLPPIQHPRFDLHTIESRVRIAQYEEATKMHDGSDMALMPTPEEEQAFAGELRTVEEHYGLPSVHDPNREEKIEAILHRMVDDNKLRFHPPNFWSIV
jgi:hypothetical protein